MAKAILVEILGDATHFEKTLNKAAGSTRSFGKVAGVVGSVIAGGLALGLEKSVAAAVDAQDSQRRLAQAFKVSHLALSDYTGEIERAQESGRKLGFTDTDVRDSLGTLVTATGDVTRSMKDLNVAQDLARFKGVDLTTATQTLAAAMSGSQRAIKALGLSITPVTAAQDALRASHEDLSTAAGKSELAHAKLQDKMATGQAVIDAVSAKTRGQGQAYSETAAGGMAEYRAQLDHLEVAIGKGLLPVLTALASSVANVTDFFAKHTAVTKIVIGTAGALAAALLAVSAATKIMAAANALATAGWWLLNVAMGANPVGAVILALVALGAGIVIAYRHSETFRDIVSAAFNVVKVVVATVITAILTYIDLYLGGLQKLFQAASHIPFVGDKFRGVADQIGGARSAVQGLQASIDNLHSKDISVTVHTVNVAGNGLGGAFAPGRAVGGPVSAGMPYTVGERGPELFVPSQDGTIVPSSPVVGSRGGGVTNYISFPNYVGSRQELARMLRDELSKMGRRDPDIFGGLA